MSLVQFWQLVPGGEPPRRASVDASGSLPSMALKYCEPIRQANSFGYLLYSPIDFGLRLDPGGVSWTWESDGAGSLGEEWQLLMPECCFPGFTVEWDARVPSELAGYTPPFISVAESGRGIIQVWPGCFARTAPDWSLLVRGVVNDFRSVAGYRVLEGLVAADSYPAHLFLNLEILATNQPIMFLKNRPIAMVTPIFRPHMGKLLDDYAVGGWDMPAERWHDFKTWVDRVRHARGQYATQERKRRASET